ncbi:peptidoglycan editing factor PgeF [Candidatus Roizmanbacteria bacterium]|nr:peptidoglycan editing factor PgeF [Candidatus Roizmanbacteria bacterium]
MSEDQPYFSSSLINGGSVFSAFSTRALGDGRSHFTITSFLKKAAISYRLLVKPEQVHSANITLITAFEYPALAKPEETDGVITNLAQVVLAVVTADCVPLLFYDKKNGVIGASHQGWRGSLKRLPQKMVDGMLSLGAEKKEICAAIGPAINDCCYDIDENRYISFMEEFESFERQIFHTRKGTRHLSLARLNFLLLTQSGLAPANIDFFPFCTSCDSERFFSYRRDSKRNYGEMFSLIARRV